eukprot:CAMPEP_0197322130 /NCGR_PEP_ID=MMETSP0891-20130614/68295_1 /TAXON_ID=44058 ORGANISM="Aureoumbra lagunensis, Strain CCMP1510" /NCGR_SAMPLE_ID=MMETSP0891 /ASSEMBLY_ACC=CAM_ASM_000534 /LENGTH=503 /DNA_ID=CAMNT_0042814369 /DNA_START=36 /DNA_END=1547 /DNA_ORIENTATION=+
MVPEAKAGGNLLTIMTSNTAIFVVFSAVVAIAAFILTMPKKEEEGFIADEILMSELSALEQTSVKDDLLQPYPSEPLDMGEPYEPKVKKEEPMPKDKVVSKASAVEEIVKEQNEALLNETTTSEPRAASPKALATLSAQEPAEFKERKSSHSVIDIPPIRPGIENNVDVSKEPVLLEKDKMVPGEDTPVVVQSDLRIPSPNDSVLKIMGTTWTHESQGGRSHMEDAHFISRSGEIIALGVFDGCGGSRASSLARDFLSGLAAKKGFGTTEKALIEALNETEKITLATSRKQGNWPDASTAVLATVNEYNTKLNIAWIGDSRAVLATQQGSKVQAHLLTNDHNAENPKEEVRIKEAGGSVGRSQKEASASGKRKMLAKVVGSSLAFKTKSKNPKRVFPGGITLTRALGGLPLKRTTPKLVIAQAESLSRTLDGSERFIILASDGVFECLSPQDAVDAVKPHILANSYSTSSSGITPAQALINGAVESGSSDNLTAVVLQLFSSS